MIRECPVGLAPASQGLLRAAIRHLRAGDSVAVHECLLESWRLAPAQLWILDLREELLVGRNGPEARKLVEGRLAERLGGLSLPSIQLLVDCREGLEGVDATLSSLGTRVAEIDVVLLLPEEARLTVADPRIRMVRCQGSENGFGPLNAAISTGATPLIVVLRCGDRPEPGLLDRMAERFFVSGGPQLLLCDGVHEDGTAVAAGGFTPLQLAWRGGLPRWTAFSREAWRAAGGFDPFLDPEMALRDFWLFCAGAGGRAEKIAHGRMVVRTCSGSVPSRRSSRDWETVVGRRSGVLTPEIRRTAAALLIQDAQTAMARGLAREALACLESACVLLPGEQRLCEMRDGLRRECGEDRAPDPQEALRAAGALFQRGSVDAALEVLDELLAVGAGVEEVWHSKAWIQMQSNRVEDACATLRQALIAHPGDAVALECLMDIDLQQGAIAEATTCASRLLAIAPDHDRAKLVLRAVAEV